MLKNTSWTFCVPDPDRTIDIALSDLALNYLPAALSTVREELGNRAPFPEDEQSLLYIFLYPADEAKCNDSNANLALIVSCIRKYLGSVNGWSLDKLQMTLDIDRPWRQTLRLHMSTLYDLAT